MAKMIIDDINTTTITFPNTTTSLPGLHIPSHWTPEMIDKYMKQMGMPMPNTVEKPAPINPIDVLEARVEALNEQIAAQDKHIITYQRHLDGYHSTKAELERQRANLQRAIDLLENELVEE